LVLSSIKFHSKINPKKEIECVEIMTKKNEKLNNEIKTVQENMECHQPEDKESITVSAVDATLANNDLNNKDILSKRRSARLKSKEDPNTNGNLNPNESKEDTIAFPSSLGECLSNTGEQIASSIEKQQNQDSKNDTKRKSYQKQKLSKMERIKFQSKILRNTNKKKKNIGEDNYVPKTREIPLKTSSSKTTLFKLKKKWNNNKKKMKKYKNLIRKFKSTAKDSNQLFTKTKELDKIKSSIDAPVSIDNKELINKEITKKEKINEDLIEEDEDNIPLSKIASSTNNKKRERQKSVENQQLNEAIEINNQKEPSELIDNSEKNDVANNQPIKTTSIIFSKSKENLATNSASNQAKTPSEIVNEAIQKLNDTPTSILKKRPQSRLTIHGINLQVSKSIDDLEDGNNTPGKRRVSFCESVKVEEIEPNFNKSFTRLTPRIQNRAKLVLSPYFSCKQQNLSPSLNSTATISSTSLITSSNSNGTILSTSSTTQSTIITIIIRHNPI